MLVEIDDTLREGNLDLLGTVLGLRECLFALGERTDDPEDPLADLDDAQSEFLAGNLSVEERDHLVRQVEQVVLALQREHGLVADGIAGAHTLILLNNLIADPDAIHITRLTQRVFDYMQPMAQQRAITLICEHADDLP